MDSEQTHRFGSQAFSGRHRKKLSNVNECAHMQRQKQRPDPTQGNSLQLSKGCLRQLEWYKHLGSHSSRNEIMAQPLCRSLKDTTELVGSHKSQGASNIPLLVEAWSRTIKERLPSVNQILKILKWLPFSTTDTKMIIMQAPEKALKQSGKRSVYWVFI